jgi:TatD DNase family protein
MYIDAHCHLTDPRYAGRLDELFLLAEQAGVRGFILGGEGPADWERQRELMQSRLGSGRVFPVFGVHPWFVDARQGSAEGRAEVEAALALLPGLLSECVGVGELGLDYGKKRSEAGHSYQREVFERQLVIVREAALPMVLHVVHAHGEALECLRGHGPFPRGGLVHAFSGSAETAQQYLSLGLTISVGGAVTGVRGYETLKRAVKTLPGDRLVVESDCPDFKPEGYPGLLVSGEGLNDPGSLPIIAEALGKLRAEPAELILARSRENLERLFGLELGLESGY